MFRTITPGLVKDHVVLRGSAVQVLSHKQRLGVGHSGHLLNAAETSGVWTNIPAISVMLHRDGQT